MLEIIFFNLAKLELNIMSSATVASAVLQIFILGLTSKQNPLLEENGVKLKPHMALQELSRHKIDFFT